MGPHRHLFAAFSLACALLAAGRLCAQQEPGDGVGAGAAQCLECGVVTGIRELQHERESARTITGRLPPVGPVFGFTFGGDAPKNNFFVGAVGSKEMRDRLVEISYEVTVRFNDGREAVVETRDGVDLRVGDPVKVINNKIELNV
jgi:hypothetical protein